MPSHYRIDRCQEGFLISLVGRGTLRESPAFRDFVAKCLEETQPVVVNLTECEWLDSTFLGCLIGLHKQSLQTDGSLLTFFAEESCRLRLLATSGLQHLFEFTATLPATLGDSLTLEFGYFDTEDLGRHVMHSHRLLAETGCKDADKFHSIADRLQEELRARGS